MKINIENGAENDPAGVFAMGIIDNLRLLRDRTMAGDMTALDEFFAIHVFNDSKAPWLPKGVEYSRPPIRDEGCEEAESQVKKEQDRVMGWAEHCLGSMANASDNAHHLAWEDLWIGVESGKEAPEASDDVLF